MDEVKIKRKLFGGNKSVEFVFETLLENAYFQSGSHCVSSGTLHMFLQSECRIWAGWLQMERTSSSNKTEPLCSLWGLGVWSLEHATWRVLEQDTVAQLHAVFATDVWMCVCLEQLHIKTRPFTIRTALPCFCSLYCLLWCAVVCRFVTADVFLDKPVFAFKHSYVFLLIYTVRGLWWVVGLTF